MKKKASHSLQKESAAASNAVVQCALPSTALLSKPLPSLLRFSGFKLDLPSTPRSPPTLTLPSLKHYLPVGERERERERKRQGAERGVQTKPQKIPTITENTRIAEKPQKTKTKNYLRTPERSERKTHHPQQNPETKKKKATLLVPNSQQQQNIKSISLLCREGV